MSCIILAFAALKFDEMIHRDRPDIKVTTLENFYESNYTLVGGRDLTFAIGLFDPSYRPLGDISMYGNFVF